MTRRKPIAKTCILLVSEARALGTKSKGERIAGELEGGERTNDREMIVLRPAAIFALDKDSLTACSCFGV